MSTATNTVNKLMYSLQKIALKLYVIKNSLIVPFILCNVNMYINPLTSTYYIVFTKRVNYFREKSVFYLKKKFYFKNVNFQFI